MNYRTLTVAIPEPLAALLEQRGPLQMEVEQILMTECGKRLPISPETARTLGRWYYEAKRPSEARDGNWGRL